MISKQRASPLLRLYIARGHVIMWRTLWWIWCEFRAWIPSRMAGWCPWVRTWFSGHRYCCAYRMKSILPPWTCLRVQFTTLNFDLVQFSTSNYKNRSELPLLPFVLSLNRFMLPFRMYRSKNKTHVFLYIPHTYTCMGQKRYDRIVVISSSLSLPLWIS
jgi:hypothetical protein